jgi:hypothetical protein
MRLPKNVVASIDMNCHGDFLALKSLPLNEKPILTAFVWMDRKSHYSISAAGSLQEGGPLYVQIQWRHQLNHTHNAALVEPVVFQFSNPKLRRYTTLTT